jgi:hypothetical protein
VPHSHIIRLILYVLLTSTCDLILYGIHAASSYTILYLIPSSSYTSYLISSGIHGSSLVPSHLKLKDEVIGEQGLAALALGKFEELYEIEEAHEIEEHYKIEEEVKGEQGLAALALGTFAELYEI